MIKAAKQLEFSKSVSDKTIFSHSSRIFDILADKI
jgi:hypothetical protein